MARAPRPPAVAFSSVETQVPMVRKVVAKEPPRPTPTAPAGLAGREDILDPASLLRPRARALTSVEARRLGLAAKTKSALQSLIVSRAHEGKAHYALGYRTWKEFCDKELDMSESRSFQLIDQAKVLREVADVGAPLERIEPPPARIVQAIKHHLPEVREHVRLALERGDDISTAIRAYAESVMESERAPAAAPRKSAARTVRCPCCEGSGVIGAREANDIKRRLGL